MDRNGVRQVFRNVRPRNWIGGFTRTFRCRILRSPDGYPPLQRGPPFQKVIRPNSSAISSAQSDVSIRFVAGGAPSVPFGAEVAIDVGVFFSSATLAELWIGSLAFRFRAPLLPTSVSPFAEGSSFSEGAENGCWAEVFGSFTDLPADFAPGSSSYSIDALFTIEFRVIAEIFSDFRKPGAGAFFNASSSFCLRQLTLKLQGVPLRRGLL